MSKSYKNAKEVLSPETLEIVQESFSGGLLYIPPKGYKGKELMEEVKELLKQGLTTAEIAERVERTPRRVNQIKRSLRK